MRKRSPGRKWRRGLSNGERKRLAEAKRNPVTVRFTRPSLHMLNNDTGPDLSGPVQVPRSPTEVTTE